MQSFFVQGNILFSNELFRRYADEGIVSTSIHPGTLRSDLYRHMSRIEKLAVVSISVSSSPWFLC